MRKPFLGNEGELERVVEYKVELVCEEPLVKEVIRALLDTHPYEEPAYSVWPLTEVTGN